MDTSTFSTERLIRLAYNYRLITDYRMMPDRIELFHAGTVYTFDPEEARFFLRGMIRGYEERGRQMANQVPVSASSAAAAA
jgi:hypothetical protein